MEVFVKDVVGHSALRSVFHFCVCISASFSAAMPSFSRPISTSAWAMPLGAVMLGVVVGAGGLFVAFDVARRLRNWAKATPPPMPDGPPEPHSSVAFADAESVWVYLTGKCGTV